MKTINQEHYVDEAQSVIERLKVKRDRNGKPIGLVTTSKIRNLLAMTDDIYNDVVNLSDEKLSPDIAARIEYLRVRFVYESGRESTVKALVEEAKIQDILKEIGTDRKNYILFTRYMEALVAFHRYYGGKD